MRGAISTLLDLRLSQGPKVKEFERLYSEYIGTKFGVACNSGSSANLLALSVLLKSGKVKAGSEVILPATTFATDASATGSSANRKRFTATPTVVASDVITLGGGSQANIALNSGTLSDTGRGGTNLAASVVLTGLGAQTITVA